MTESANAIKGSPLFVACPCCHGHGFLDIYVVTDKDEYGISRSRLDTSTMCCHCQGKGRMLAEAL